MHRRARRATGRVLVTAVGLLSSSGIAVSLESGLAAAHDVGGSRFAAPLPLPWLVGAAAATVGLTALWLAVTERRVDDTGAIRVRAVPDTVASALSTLARLTFLAVVLAVILCGITGPQIAAENLATVFTWPVWFKGLAIIAVLVGSPWPVLSPWRTVYDALSRLEGRPIAVLGRYPKRLAEWPALVGFVLLVGVLGPLTVVPESPRRTAIVVASYALWMLGGALLYGDTWLQRADPLGVLYRLFGRVAPVGVVGTGDRWRAVELTPPWRGCLTPVESRSLVVFVVATVYTVSFDGVTNTGTFQRSLFATAEVVGTTALAGLGLYLGGLVAFVAAFVLVIALVERAGVPAGAGFPSGTVGSSSGTVGSSWSNAARHFAPTVLPIAAAYEVAHTYPSVLRNLGQLWAVVGRPLPPAVEPLALTGWLSLPVFWGSQVVLIVLGHVLAVVAAHYVAVDRYESVDRARRAHLPLVVLMVGYTVLSLWIVSRPVVT